MNSRIVAELELLRAAYPDLEHADAQGEVWVHLPTYHYPPGWLIGNKPIDVGPVVFPVNGSYPMGEPYGFLTPAGINFGGSPPQSTGSPRSPPFGGQWQFFSWAPEGWSPSNDISKGSNLLAWARSFAARLREGA